MVLIPAVRHLRGILLSPAMPLWWALGPFCCWLFLVRLWAPGHGQSRFSPGSSHMSCAGAWRHCMGGEGLLACALAWLTWACGCLKDHSYPNHWFTLRLYWAADLLPVSIPDSEIISLLLLRSCLNRERLSSSLLRKLNRPVVLLLFQESPFYSKVTG